MSRNSGSRERNGLLLRLKKIFEQFPLVSCYFAYGTVNGADTSVAQQGYNIELNTDSSSFTIWPQPGGHRVGFNNMTAPSNQNVINLEIDPWSGFGMIIQNGQVFYYDFQDPSPTIMPYDYVSKIYQQQSKRATPRSGHFLPCRRIRRQSTNVRMKRRRMILAGIRCSLINAQSSRYMPISADENKDGTMQLVTCREITRSGGILRIESGFKAENWQFEILGVVNFSNVQIATSVKELGNI